jgi:hypothetical protein
MSHINKLPLRGRAAPNADRSELADTGDAAVGQEPRKTDRAVIQPTAARAIRSQASSARSCGQHLFVFSDPQSNFRL